MRKGPKKYPISAENSNFDDFRYRPTDTEKALSFHQPCRNVYAYKSGMLYQIPMSAFRSRNTKIIHIFTYSDSSQLRTCQQTWWTCKNLSSATKACSAAKRRLGRTSKGFQSDGGGKKSSQYFHLSSLTFDTDLMVHAAQSAQPKCTCYTVDDLKINTENMSTFCDRINENL